MISHYYKPLTQRSVTLTDDGGGSYSETKTDTAIYGFISVMSASEQLNNFQLGVVAEAKLFTEADIKNTDRIIDSGNFYPGGAEFEVIGSRMDVKGNKFYSLKKIR